jgi:uncharacterized protein (TIGR03084 family)
MAVDMAALTADLAAETEDLFAMLTPLADADWDLPTPAAGWAIRDQVSHLAFFDEAATLAATDPARFERETQRLMAELGADFTEAIARQHRHLSPGELRDWLAHARAEYLRVFAGLGPSDRLPWYGPPMSAASSVTARLMETWAHGQDIADALGYQREPTARLRHVAHLGVSTMAFSFGVRGQPVPQVPVRVELAAPRQPGEQDTPVWTWGPSDVANRVEGDALDFCLLVTQRRNRADTRLRATGPVAGAWLDLAQAFAGPPGPGRPPTDAGPPRADAGPPRADAGPPGAGGADEEGGR